MTDREKFEKENYQRPAEPYTASENPEQWANVLEWTESYCDWLENKNKEQQKKIDALEAENPQVPCPACESNYAELGCWDLCAYCEGECTISTVKAQEYRIKELEAEIDRLKKANNQLLEMVR
jgi:hypothetical protein